MPSTLCRITVDTGLTWSSSGGLADDGLAGDGLAGDGLAGDGRRAGMPGMVIVETKAARAASDVDRLLRSLGHRPRSISKYGTGLAALRPDLPANRWRTVLDRHVL